MAKSRIDLALPGSPAFIPLIHRQLEHYRLQYEQHKGSHKGNEALLQALYVCLRHFQGSPNWVAAESSRAILDWLTYRKATLDEAFGVQRPGKHTAQRRERDRERARIVLEVTKLKQQDLSDTQAFIRVGKLINKSFPYVRDRYNEPESAGLRKLFRYLPIQPLEDSTE